MRYFALQYAPPDHRERLAALFVIESEISTSALAAHEIAHTRLHWWRSEIDRLVNRSPSHPATQSLLNAMPAGDFSGLHELMVAADMDLARMTYQTAAELDAYLRRSGSSLTFYAQDQDAEAQVQAHAMGALIRRVETLRDSVMHARAGRIYWSLDELDARKISVVALQQQTIADSVRELISSESHRVDAALQVAIDRAPSSIRPLAVLAQLHLKLLRRIARFRFDIFSRRHELGGVEKVWTAWRAARRS
jgi:phytoene synthase